MDVFSGSSHAVLFDKEETDRRNDHHYYFKDSRGPNIPYIKILIYRCTFDHITLCQKAARGELHQDLETNFQQPNFNWVANQVRREIQKINPKIDMHPQNQQWWTIDKLFLLSIKPL